LNSPRRRAPAAAMLAPARSMKTFGPDDFLSREELGRFLSQCLSDRDRAILLVAYRHGLRPSEVGLLRVSDADLGQGTLRCRRLRGAPACFQPLAPDEVGALGPLVLGRGPLEPLFPSARGLPISRKRLDAIMKSCGRKAGLPPGKRHFRVLRTSLAAHLLRAGADPALVEEILGLGPRRAPSPLRGVEHRQLLTSGALALAWENAP
jgi:integrase